MWPSVEPRRKSARQIPAGENPSEMTSDGTHIWVTNNIRNGTVTELEDDGRKIGEFDAGTFPCAKVFGGANMWIANSAQQRRHGTTG